MEHKMLEQYHEKLFPFLHNTSVWTITSGTLGGLYKTLNHYPIMLNSATLDGSVSVALYTFLSAAVGYCTKKGLDYLFRKFKRQ